MPITINGSGTVSGISAGGLPDGCITTADIAANAVTYAKLGTTEQGQLCKAWVNFDGTGTVAIRASYNVSSITKTGTGIYTVNFTTAMASANYAGLITAVSRGPALLDTFATGSVRATCYEQTGFISYSYVDQSSVNVAVFS